MYTVMSLYNGKKYYVVKTFLTDRLRIVTPDEYDSDKHRLLQNGSRQWAARLAVSSSVVLNSLNSTHHVFIRKIKCL